LQSPASRNGYCKSPLLEKRKDISIAKRTSFMTAEVAAQIGGAAVEDERPIDAAGDRQPCPPTFIRRNYRYLFVLYDETGVTRRKFIIVNPDGERAAAPRHNALIVKVQPQCSQSRFDAGGAVVIADQRIRHPKRVSIERAAN
jgi:hypothetical protein